MRTSALHLALALALASCDASVAPAADAGDRDASSAPSFAPNPPVLTPCPPGWREVASGDRPTTCEPWPAGYDETCADDEAHVPGAMGCERLGSPCAADGWPVDLPTDRPIVYVDPAAAAGGDGSTRERAYASLALARAPPRAVLALAVGAHEIAGTLALGADTWLVGACVAGTRITARDPGTQALFIVEGLRARIRDVTFDAPERAALSLGGDDVVLERVVVTGARGTGIHVFAGDVTATDVSIRDMRASDAAFATDVGLFVRSGARIELARASVIAFAGVGVIAEGAGASIVLRDSVLRGGVAGRGISAGEVAVLSKDGARVALERSVIEAGRGFGLFAEGSGSEITARDVVIRDLGDDAGAHAQGGARVDLERVWIERVGGAGADGNGAGTRVTVADALIADTRTTADAMAHSTSGVGVAVSSLASLAARRVWIERSRSSGLFAFDADVALEDVSVRDTQPLPIGDEYGMGVWFAERARVTGTRVRVTSSHLAGIAAVRSARVTLAGVEVADTRLSACAASTCPTFGGGFGIVAQRGGALDVSDFVVAGSALCGVVLGRDADDGTPTALDLRRGTVRGAPVGACVQVEGYDSTRLRDAVQYIDVDVPLQATSYSLPPAL